MKQIYEISIQWIERQLYIQRIMFKWIKSTWNERYFENSYSHEMKLLESEIAWKLNCLRGKGMAKLEM